MSIKVEDQEELTLIFKSSCNEISQRSNIKGMSTWAIINFLQIIKLQVTWKVGIRESDVGMETEFKVPCCAVLQTQN